MPSRLPSSSNQGLVAGSSSDDRCWQTRVSGRFDTMASIKDLLIPEDQLATEALSSFNKQITPVTEASAHFTIEFVLDTICPHCYVGLRNLNQAIDTYKARHPGSTFEVICTPFILNPVAQRSGKLPGAAVSFVSYIPVQHSTHFAPEAISLPKHSDGHPRVLINHSHSSQPHIICQSRTDQS